MNKTIISRVDFSKKVEMEYCWLVRWEYMKKGEAWVKATETVQSSFTYED